MLYIKARPGALIFLLAFATGLPAATVGELSIIEILANPAAVSELRGEWFELYDPTGETIDLNGTTLGDDGGDRHRIESDLLTLPEHFLVLAHQASALLDGGFAPDYVPRNFILGNSADEIVPGDGTLECLRHARDTGFTASRQYRLAFAIPGQHPSSGKSTVILVQAGIPRRVGESGDPGSLA